MKIFINKCDKDHQNIDDMDYNIIKDFTCVFKELEYSHIKTNNLVSLSVNYLENNSMLDYRKVLEGFDNLEILYTYFLVNKLNLSELEEFEQGEYSRFIHSITKVNTDVHAICYKFNEIKDINNYFNNNIMNYINKPNGIWLNEIPDLKFVKDVLTENLVPLIQFKECFMEFSSDADVLTLYFNNNDSLKAYISKLQNNKNIYIEEQIYECHTKSGINKANI